MPSDQPDMNTIVEAVEAIDGVSIVNSTVYYEEDGLVEFGIEAKWVADDHPQAGGNDAE